MFMERAARRRKPSITKSSFQTVKSLGLTTVRKRLGGQRKSFSLFSPSREIGVSMQYLKCDVSTICIGLAASFGAFLLAGGAKGKRIALPNAEIMIHQPLIGGNGVHGPVTDIQIVTEQMQKTKQRLTRILSENTGRPFAQVAADTERDNYMSAEEALAYGLIDKIIDKR